MVETNKFQKSYTRIFWILGITPFVLLLIIFILISAGKLGYMPDFATLENPKTNIATEIYSEDGKVLGSFYFQNRMAVDYKDLPPDLIHALVATEDIRFYKHSGIDPRGLARVFFKTLVLGKKSAGGGSTITQQLAKNLFPRDTTFYQSKIRRSIGLTLTKFREWVTAVKLEKAYTKNEILTMYFNQFDFLYNAVGIKSAAKVYFNTVPDSLDMGEAATLVGMAKNPSLYNPVRYPEEALKRRNIVFGQMEKYGFIDQEQYDSLITIPLKIDFQRVNHDKGIATYFREFLRQKLTASMPDRKNYRSYSSYKEDSTQWANDPLYGWCNKNLRPNGMPYNIYTDGLKIYSTVNYEMQEFAEEAVAKHMADLQSLFFKMKKGYANGPFSSDLTRKQIDLIIRRAILSSQRGRSLRNNGASWDSIYRAFKRPVEMTVFSWHGDVDTTMSPLDSILYYKHFLQTGFMSMDPVSGDVRAYVGGLDLQYFKYDHVTQSKRQAGSTFKPFLYILAMQEGYTPCYKVPNVSQTFPVGDSTWTPRSESKPKDKGKLKTLKWGLARSENNIAAWLVSRFKPQPIAEIAHRMGITSYIDPVPPIIYGTSDMTVEEMVAAYATFANKGIHTEPIFVTRIEDKNGNLLATFQPEHKEAISEKTAYLMLSLMEGVTGRGKNYTGTAYALRWKYGLTAPIAGKTGTTNNYSDGWFIGITPKLVSGGWVGAEDRSVHFNSGYGSGSYMALPIWALYMQKVYADSTLGYTQNDDFEKPEGFNVNLNCDDDSIGNTNDNYGYDDNDFSD